MSTHAAHGTTDGRPTPPVLSTPPTSTALLAARGLDSGTEVTVTAGPVVLSGRVEPSTVECLIVATSNSLVRFPWANIDAIRTARPVPAHPALDD